MMEEEESTKELEADSPDPEEESTQRSSMEVDPPGQKADYDDDEEEEEEEEEGGDDEEEDQDDNDEENKQEQPESVADDADIDNENDKTDGKSPVKEETVEAKTSEKEKEIDKNDIEEDEDEEEEEQKEDAKEEVPIMGGKNKKKSFCLLDGIFEKDGEKKRVTIPLTRLPAVLGRSHATGDRNFFTLGPSKALSRQHAIISFRDETGGKLVTPKNAAKDSDEEDKLEYEKAGDEPFSIINPGAMENIKQEGEKENSPKNAVFPPRGAYVLEALGKNLIMVGNQRIRPGEKALLTPGIPIRMSSYSFYFLMPLDIADPPKTLEIPLQEKPSPPKKAGTKRKMPSSPKDMPQPKLRKPKAAPFAQLQAELDTLPIDTLLERMNEACKAARWERKHQLIGSTISFHAVKDAAKDPEIRKMAADGGVPRTEIMKWIKQSPKYSNWVEQMMSKMEAKSYQNTITKALLKAGNERTGTGGRYIKWIFPDVPLNPTSKEGKSDDKNTDKDGSNPGRKGGEGGEDDEEGEEEGEGDEEDDNEEDGDEDDENAGSDNQEEEDNENGEDGQEEDAGDKEEEDEKSGE